MKTKKIFIGLTLILVATALILDAIGIIPALATVAGEFSWWVLAACIVLFSFAVTQVFKGQIGGIFIPLSLIFMLIEPNVATLCGRTDPNIINNWLLLGCAVLLSIGFALLFKGNKKRHHYKLSSAVSFVDAPRLENQYYTNKLGDLTIRFDNADQYTGGGTLHIDCKLANTTIEVPAGWRYTCTIDAKPGTVEEKNNNPDPTAPLLTIKGRCRLGVVTVVRV